MQIELKQTPNGFIILYCKQTNQKFIMTRIDTFMYYQLKITIEYCDRILFQLIISLLNSFVGLSNIYTEQRYSFLSVAGIIFFLWKENKKMRICFYNEVFCLSSEDQSIFRVVFSSSSHVSCLDVFQFILLPISCTSALIRKKKFLLFNIFFFGCIWFF